MRNGLKVIQLTGSYYGYAVTIVGWLRRVGGDEFHVLAGARVAFRTGEAKSLARLAADGPGKNYKLLDPSEAVEEVNRLLVRRCFVADEKAWAKHCPRPKDWQDDGGAS